GDPETGAGATGALTTTGFTTRLADIVPAVCPSASRWRLCTHAREQLYRPAYAQAWDGADVLPEQHFRGLLGNDPYVERAISFPQWGRRSTASEPVGAIELLNAGGHYNALREWTLRDQAVSCYELDTGSGVPEHVARG